MSGKQLDDFIGYLEANNITIINPQALTLKEIKSFAKRKGFDLTVEDLKLRMKVIQQKGESDITPFESNWCSHH